METIILCDLPAPNGTKKNICLIFDDEITLKVLAKLEELGWVWNGRGMKPTQYLPPHPFKIWLYESEICQSFLNRSTAGWIELKIVDVVSLQKTINLKTANTSPSATNCVSCGGKLKDPGMGPLYKHCPKCEP
jgi:hypothetical protein